MKKKILSILLLFFLCKVEAQTSTFAVADSLFANGRYKIALQELEKLPNSFQKNLKIASIYEAIDNYQQTILVLEKALSFVDDKTVKLKLAQNYQVAKQYQKSIKIYEELISKDTLNLLLNYQLGKLYLATKNGEKAVSTFKKLIKNDASNANYSYQLGLAYSILSDRDRMINSFIDTYKKDTTHIKSIEVLAKSFQKLNDADSTQLFVNKGLKLEPKNDALNRLKINHLYKEKQFKEALYHLHNLDSLPQEDTYVQHMMGRTYYQMDSLGQAKKYFRNLLKISFDDYKAHYYLGNISLLLKDYRTAEFHFLTSTVAGKEQRDEEYYGLATLYYETEKPLQALKMFEKAVEENSNNYKAAYQLAKLTDDYYKEKKLAYTLYKRYFRKFESVDKDITAFVSKRIEEIKTAYFMKGENLE